MEKPRTRAYVFPVGSEEWRVIPRLLGGAAGFREAPFVGVPTAVRSGFGAGEGFSVGTYAFR